MEIASDLLERSEQQSAIDAPAALERLQAIAVVMQDDPAERGATEIALVQAMALTDRWIEASTLSREAHARLEGYPDLQAILETIQAVATYSAHVGPAPHRRHRRRRDPWRGRRRKEPAPARAARARRGPHAGPSPRGRANSNRHTPSGSCASCSKAPSATPRSRSSRTRAQGRAYAARRRGRRQKGLAVKVRGHATGTRVQLTAKSGKRTVATGSAKVGRSGNATVVLRFTKAGKRVVRGRSRPTLVITGAGAQPTTVVLRGRR